VNNLGVAATGARDVGERRRIDARAQSPAILVVDADGLHERLILWIEQPDEELVDGGSSIDDRLATHAIAGVEQHAQAYRHTLDAEVGHPLGDTVLEDLEVALRQAGNEVPW
jgi:hypothetical protein